ncbi:MAG: bifunctional riboflavin kinase/FAD synthetase [Bacteroidetes bacterium]|nr:bifunctional riboflavin kinase/FAD synthetase [Bacteroidota bacterium]
MKVYRNLEEFQRLPFAVVTQGTFDGVHLGHQKILNQIKALANENNGETVLITFFPHPRMVLQPEDNGLKLLETIEEKINHLERMGINHLLILPFTKSFSRLTAQEFVRDILVEGIGTKIMVVGYDHRFGKNREGSFQELKQLSSVYNFEVQEIAAEDIDAVTISSTKIRNALLSGDLVSANTFLGYDYRAKGEVIRGHQKGKTLGFPTANIQVAPYKLIPGDGVYAVEVVFNGRRYRGMTNIGSQPTFTGRAHAFEVNIFDFDQEIYNQEIEVIFHAHLRPEIKFDSVDALKRQLEKDKFAALNVLLGH